MAVIPFSFLLSQSPHPSSLVFSSSSVSFFARLVRMLKARRASCDTSFGCNFEAVLVPCLLNIVECCSKVCCRRL